MQAFRPVPAHQACRFSLCFGDIDRSTSLLVKDVPDRLLNRVSVNAAVVALGRSSVAQLDALAHAAQLELAPRGVRLEPDNFWKRVASGMPRLRLDGKDGVSQLKLSRKMPFLGAGQGVLECVRRWPLWALIHPDPIDREGLDALEELIADVATTNEWFETIDRSVSPADQGARLVKLVKDEKLELALNAHWLALRCTCVEADLARYAHLYYAWLMLRPLLESHPLFKNAAPLLYQFTAYWFGQVEIITDRFLVPLNGHQAQYLNFVEATLASLRQGAEYGTGRAWEPLKICITAEDAGMQVRPKGDLLAHYFNGEQFRDAPFSGFLEAWTLIAMLCCGERAACNERPGLKSRPNNWRSGYATSHMVPIDVDRWVTAAQLGKALGGLSEYEVKAQEQSGKLFSVPDGNGAKYPSFQALPEICGEPLERVLRELGPLSANGISPWDFFTSRSELLVNLSPIEILLADPRRSRSSDPDAQRLLRSSNKARLLAIVGAARTYRSTLGT